MFALLVCSLVGQPVPTDPPADKHPLPVNGKLAGDRLAARLDWLRQQWVGDFDRTADKNAPGHAEARKAVELAAEVEARIEMRVQSLIDARAQAVKAATKAGSTHPLVRALHNRHVAAPGTAQIMNFVGEFTADKYSPFVRLGCYRDAATEAEHYGQEGEREQYVRTCAAAVAELAAGPSPVAAGYADRLVVAVLDDRAFGPNALVRLEALKPALAEPKVPARFRDLAAGSARVSAAWESRGSGFGNTVSDDQFKRFKEHLTAAEPLLTAAWKANPAEPLPAVRMISVCMGLGRDRDEMETWFRRAVEADPDNYSTYRTKLSYLLPQWNGSEDELLAYGRQCLKASRPDNRLADILYEAHHQFNRNRSRAYWRQPAVWADVVAVHKSGIAAFPTDRQLRTRFARLAWVAGYPELADENLKAIKDRVLPSEFGSPAAAANFRAEVDAALEAARLAKEKPE